MTNKLILAGAVVAAVVAAFWLLAKHSLSQAEQLGGLEQAMTMATTELQSSERQKRVMIQRQEEDQQSLKALALHRQAAEQQSRQLANELEEALQHEPCATTPLPQSVSDRLRNRLHRQARTGAGTPPG